MSLLQTVGGFLSAAGSLQSLFGGGDDEEIKKRQQQSKNSLVEAANLSLNFRESLLNTAGGQKAFIKPKRPKTIAYLESVIRRYPEAARRAGKMVAAGKVSGPRNPEVNIAGADPLRALGKTQTHSNWYT